MQKITISQTDKAAVRALVDELGETETCRILWIARQTLSRLLADLTVHHGTIALVRERLSAR